MEMETTMDLQASDLPHVPDRDFPWRLFEMADRQFDLGNDLVGAKISEIALPYALFDTHRVPIPALMMLDIQRHLRRRRHGRLERISIRNGALNHDRAFIAFPSKRFARRIEYHLDFYRPRLLLDDSCNRMFPSLTGASSIDSSLRRRTGLFDFCLLADVYGSRSSRSPTGASSIDFPLRRRMVTFAVCMTV